MSSNEVITSSSKQSKQMSLFERYLTLSENVFQLLHKSITPYNGSFITSKGLAYSVNDASATSLPRFGDWS